MKEIQQPEACSGTLTPQLEGAARSLSHPERAHPEAQPKLQKGGTNHE